MPSAFKFLTAPSRGAFFGWRAYASSEPFVQGPRWVIDVGFRPRTMASVGWNVSADLWLTRHIYIERPDAQPLVSLVYAGCRTASI